MRGMPDDPQLGAARCPRHASSSTSIPLYGRISPKHSTTGASVVERAAAPCRRPVRRGEVLERAVRDHVHARGLDAQLAGQAPPAVLGVHDDRVEAVVQAPLGVALPGAGLAREDVVRGQHQRARPRGRQQAPSRCWTASHWKCTTSAPRAARR